MSESTELTDLAARYSPACDRLKTTATHAVDWRWAAAIISRASARGPLAIMGVGCKQGLRNDGRDSTLTGLARPQRRGHFLWRAASALQRHPCCCGRPQAGSVRIGAPSSWPTCECQRRGDINRLAKESGGENPSRTVTLCCAPTRKFCAAA